MTDTKLRVIRQYLAAVKSYDLKPSENMLSETEARTLNAAQELLAHIDALAAEVERLHGYLDNMAIIETGLELERDSLRDVVREADILIQEEIRQCSIQHPDSTSEHVRTCAVCKELYAWVEKAAKV